MSSRIFEEEMKIDSKSNGKAIGWQVVSGRRWIPVPASIDYSCAKSAFPDCLVFRRPIVILMERKNGDTNRSLCEGVITSWRCTSIPRLLMSWLHRRVWIPWIRCSIYLDCRDSIRLLSTPICNPLCDLSRFHGLIIFVHTIRCPPRSLDAKLFVSDACYADP